MHGPTVEEFPDRGVGRVNVPWQAEWGPRAALSPVQASLLDTERRQVTKVINFLFCWLYMVERI